ncbi:MAG: hypothetical protein LBT36_04025 [Oscillospiraceae bacterium]|nr:hypothetical protein [Oscillospiraceae bacterium]
MPRTPPTCVFWMLAAFAGVMFPCVALCAAAFGAFAGRAVFFRAAGLHACIPEHRRRIHGLRRVVRELFRSQ